MTKNVAQEPKAKEEKDVPVEQVAKVKKEPDTKADGKIDYKEEKQINAKNKEGEVDVTKPEVLKSDPTSPQMEHQVSVEDDSIPKAARTEAVVEKVVVPPNKEVVFGTNTPVYREIPAQFETREEMADKLGIDSGLSDARTGEKILPSTPALRVMMEQKQKAEEAVKTSVDFTVRELLAQSYSEKVLSDPYIKYIVDTMTDYVRAMSPDAAIDETVGGQYQTRLARLYDTVLSQSDAELADVGLNIVNKIIKQNIHKAFDARYALRFANTQLLDESEARRFHMLTTLFTSLATGTKKSELAKVLSVQKLLDYIPDRNAKSNLSDFISQ